MKNKSLKQYLALYFFVGVACPICLTLYVFNSWMASENAKNLSLFDQTVESEKRLVRSRINEVKIALSMLDDSQVVIEFIALPLELRSFTSPRLVSKIKSAINEISVKNIKWELRNNNETIFKDFDDLSEHIVVKSDVAVDSQGIYDPDNKVISTIYAYIPIESLMKDISSLKAVNMNDNSLLFTKAQVDFNNEVYVIIPIVFTLIIVFLLLSLNIIKHQIVDPIITQIDKLKSKHDLLIDTSMTNNEIDVLDFYIDEFVKTVESRKELQAIDKVSQEVSHDIKSPLTSLSYLIEKDTDLNEKERELLLKQSFYRIKSIVNSLDFKFKGNDDKEKKTTYLLGLTITNIVAEKRIEYIERDDVEIILENNLSSDVFIHFDLSAFQRAISNIINNSIESQNDKNMEIIIVISEYQNECFIEIQDNGCGISVSSLDKVFERGETIGKSGGNGLGLSQAMDAINEIDGEIRIESELNIGTVVSINLKKNNVPFWFHKKIPIFNRKKICIIDDDISIHNAWLSRLAKSGLEVVTFVTFEETEKWLAKQLNRKEIYFLCDYDISLSKKDGIDFIDSNELQNQSTLVTSLYLNNKVVSLARSRNIKVMPKELIFNIKLDLIHCLSSSTVVLIDDDRLIRKVWHDIANMRNVNFLAFEDIASFIKNKSKVDKSATIFIDSYISKNEKGEEASYNIYKNGFFNLYLATSKNIDYIPYWIIGKVSKEWPL